jgi:signal transduction histidine kinase
VTRAWQSLRVQLAGSGFLAIYVPLLVLFGVFVVTENETATDTGGGEVVSRATAGPSGWAIATLVALAPVAAALAWWWAGRAIQPLRSAADTQRLLIEETSHEVRTPLAVLTTNADVLLGHPQPTLDLYRAGLERSRDAALRLQRTIDDLLVDARGRARTIDRSPADVAAIARGVAEDARLLAAAREVEITVGGASSAVLPVDEQSIRRAISNLVDNAIRHSPAGGVVAVEVTVTDHPVEVTVTDHGPGIPPDQHDRVFDRFWRGADGEAGTGLGLPIVQQIAAAHGGTIALTSPGPDGDGCVFTLVLPHR